jgi:hypothetical protein
LQALKSILSSKFISNLKIFEKEYSIEELVSSFLKEMVRFIARVHKLKPNRIREKFLPANFACFSIDDYLKKYFQQCYLNYIAAGEEYKKRLELVKKIIDIEWLAIYLYSMTPEKIKIRKFSDKNFDESAYLKTQYLKFHNRLKIIENGLLAD